MCTLLINLKKRTMFCISPLPAPLRVPGERRDRLKPRPVQIRGRLRPPPRPGLIPVDISHGVGHLQDLWEEGGHHKGQVEVRKKIFSWGERRHM